MHKIFTNIVFMLVSALCSRKQGAKLVNILEHT